MNYTDLKIIWDQQTDQPLFTVDHDSILASVMDRCNVIDSGIKWFDRYIIPVSLFAGIPLILQFFIDSEPSWPSLCVGILFVMKAIFTWTLLRTRKKQERTYEEAVIPCIDKALLQNKHVATLLKRHLAFFHLPAALIGLIGILFYPTGQTPWIWIFFVVIIAYSIWDTPRYLRIKLAKERQALQAIRSRLLETKH
ncbi:MAG: hypothetical protein AAGA96_17475 [Verrucomicrobiota bacterium]